MNGRLIVLSQLFVFSANLVFSFFKAESHEGQAGLEFI